MVFDLELCEDCENINLDIIEAISTRDMKTWKSKTEQLTNHIKVDHCLACVSKNTQTNRHTCGLSKLQDMMMKQGEI